jgi:predicted ATPase
MLKRIHIKGFRSCHDVLLEDLGPLTAIVGRNGSGKTNILRAINWLARAATTTDTSAQFLRVAGSSSSTLTADIELNGTMYRYCQSQAIKEVRSKSSQHREGITLNESLARWTTGTRWEDILRRNDREVLVQHRTSPIRLGAEVPCLSGLMALLPEDEELHRHLSPLLGYFKRTRYYPIDEVNDVPALDGLSIRLASDYRIWAAEWQATGDAGDSVLLRLIYAHFQKPTVFDEIRVLLGSKGLDLIDDIAIDEVRPTSRPEVPPGEEDFFYLIRFRPGRALGKSSRLLSYGDLSLGTRRILHMITSLLVDGSSLLLLEHPEDGIHRGLLRKLIGLLRANVDPTQVILSSHSALVVNDLTTQDVRLVSIHRGATHVRKLTPKETEAATRFIEEEGTLADFLESVEE